MNGVDVFFNEFLDAILKKVILCLWWKKIDYHRKIKSCLAMN